jgi:hypothetical protein
MGRIVRREKLKERDLGAPCDGGSHVNSKNRGSKQLRYVVCLLINYH